METVDDGTGSGRPAGSNSRRSQGSGTVFSWSRPRPRTKTSLVPIHCAFQSSGRIGPIVQRAGSLQGARAPVFVPHLHLPPALHAGGQRLPRVLDEDGPVRRHLAGIPEVAFLVVQERPAARHEDPVAGLPEAARVRIGRLQAPAQPRARDVEAERLAQVLGAEIDRRPRGPETLRKRSGGRKA